MELHDCLQRLKFADQNNDAELSHREYAQFSNDLSNNADLFLTYSFDQLSPPIQANFETLACTSSDCSHGVSKPLLVDLSGLYDDYEATPLLKRAHFQKVCDDTEAALDQDDDSRAAIATPRQASTPAPTPTIPSCFITLTLLDDKDGILSKQEFVVFVKQVITSNTAYATFEDLPPLLQQVYTSRTNGGGVNIDGAIPGSATPAQDAFLTGFCTATFEAIISDVNDRQFPTTPPMPSRTVPPIPTSAPVPAPTALVQQAPGDGITTTPGPTTSQNICFLALRINDRGEPSNVLNQDEYTAFVNQISGRKFNNVAFVDLPVNLQAKYAELSTGAAGINILGAADQSAADAAQLDFLKQLCLEVDEEIAVALEGPSPTVAPAPTVAPGPPPTVAPRPSNPGSQPTFPGFTLPPLAIPSPSPVNPPTASPVQPPTGPPTPVTRPPFSRPTINGRPTFRPFPAPPTPAPNSGTSPTFPPVGFPTLAPAEPPTLPPALPPTPAPVPTLPPAVPTRAPVVATPEPTSPAPTSPAPTPSPTPVPSPAPTNRPSPAPTPTPTAAPTLPPTPRPTFAPSANPTVMPEGELFVGRVTFQMSNSLYLDEDHLISGERRSDLNEAFFVMAEKLAIAGPEVERGDRGNSRSRNLRGGDNHRELIIWFGYAKVENITNMECPSAVPDDGTLCQFCRAEFALVSINEGRVGMEARVTALEGQIDAAIKRGELQKELDIVQPDTPLRIEEGQVRKRDTPPGVFSIASLNTTTAALIGIGVAAVAMILFCLWCWGFCCCFNSCCGGGSSPTKYQAPELKEAAQKPEPTKKGWFG